MRTPPKSKGNKRYLKKYRLKKFKELLIKIECYNLKTNVDTLKIHDDLIDYVDKNKLYLYAFTDKKEGVFYIYPYSFRRNPNKDDEIYFKNYLENCYDDVIIHPLIDANYGEI